MGNQNEELKEASASKKVEKLEFRGGPIIATVPLVFFIIWAIALSVANLVSEPALILGIVIGLSLGLLLSKSKWADYAQGLFDGMAQPIGVVAIIAWFWAGMFATSLQAGGLVDGLIWFGFQTGFEGGMFVGLTFILASLFSSAVGTGYGTVAAFGILVYPAGVVLGADPVILLAAILSGAVFGDNLAPVSDTTIVSATTQEADVPGVVRSRFKYSIAAAIPALILFVIFGGGDGLGDTAALAELKAEVSPGGLIFLIPFAIVLILALSGHHLLTSLTWGIVASVIMFPILGLPLTDIIHIYQADDGSAVVEGALMGGLSGYFNMAILILFILSASHLLELAGTMEKIMNFFIRIINGVARRAELSIYAIVAFLNTFITINTAAEIAAAPFVSKIGKNMNLHPYRRANFLDTVSSSLGYIFPWSGGVLLAYTTINGVIDNYGIPGVNPIEVVPFVFQGWGLMIVMLIAALTGWGLRYTGKKGEEVKPQDYKG
ncbi:Na+/H+ antiporter NhaC family protein [Tenuibacillus multivorans]|uniref:Na+/H+ antiporter NhaC n=1 Tax=Tenuibacillus multivorans TaxID=237069 RepID=A0A1H0AMZ3_9BACI|nr:Na+/H+ antiporter NhaC family protein [Tenuibacillus multivorans]GEL78215.1 sodium:proton antiporter [Tenuibacillus multivorans]SDN34942.1 Na+/H+ antiporter NhaC [Tenuibacillus multivorans]